MNGMMKKMKKWLACGAIVTASAVLLAGCGGQNTDKSSGSAAGSGDKIVAYGVIDPQISAQQIIADKKGYFKEEGLNVSAEVCPHHFTLTSDDIKKFVPQIENGILIPHETDADTNYKMNPPLRTKKDVEALKEGLRDNIMDVISTDHAPHTFDDKNTSMKKAPFGIVGLETAACLTYTELVLGGYLTPMQMAEKMSYNPAKIIGIDKGDIQKGKKADVVIFDPKETYKIDKNTFASKGRNTPFDGREVTGRVKVTICDGNIVYGEC